MPNLEAQAAWVPVREIGIELARGGPNGNMNEQATALLARTEWLNQQKAGKSEIVQGHYEFNTYAEFNAIKSTLPLNCTVIINEIPTGTQTWGQGTNLWNGTTLTKSAYDPIESGKVFARSVIDVFDASATSGNYNLSLQDAVALVPVELRKRYLKVKYNNSETRHFINSDIANWGNPKLWLRVINQSNDGMVNFFDERMIYDGLSATSTANSINYTLNPTSSMIVIPILRSYDENGVELPLNISFFPKTTTATQMGFLNENGANIGSLSSKTEFKNEVIPADAKYIIINAFNQTNRDLIKNNLKYFPTNNVRSTDLGHPLSNGVNSVQYSPSVSLVPDYTANGVQVSSPYFVGNNGTLNGLHIAQLVKFVEIQKGQKSLISKSTGNYRRFFFRSFLRASATPNRIQVQISGETEAGVIEPNLPVSADIDTEGYASIEWSRLTDGDPIRIRAIIDCRDIPVGRTLSFGDNGEVHPNIVAKSASISGVNRGVQVTEYVNFGVAATASNMAQEDAQPVSVNRSMRNGFLYHAVLGDADKDHQQTTLIGTKLARFNGVANIYVDASADYPTNPPVNMLRNKSSISFNSGNPAGNGILGETMDHQWIHPDMCYAPDGVGGFKYWMINSVFPNGNDRREDAEMFVSNDGQNWTRVRGFEEADDSGLPFKNPQVFWNSNHKNAFMPIPISGSFEFARESVIDTKTITGYLNHDPAISYHDGYVNVYILYNLGFSNLTYDHKYVVCYRTNNGVDWEIVREDGTTMPYNQENALKIFTKTNGVRNHVCFKYQSGGIGAVDLSPQVVKVSDSEWYYYARNTDNTTPSQGVTLNLVRYAGTSPYSFDFTKPQIISRNDSKGGVLWHYGMRYINGVFYCLFNGFMITSTDGLNFTTTQYPFFWRGMSSDLYKPTFALGHDGKVKIAYGLQTHLAAPHAYAPQRPVDILNLNKVQQAVKIVSTQICEYSSLSDIMNRGSIRTRDAYADVVVMSISQRTKNVSIRLLPCLRSYTELLNSIDVSYDDEVYVVAHLNTRNGGSLSFSGVAVTLPNSLPS
ncbi:hypothetical protein [Acinetobacter schindleri]|uniref:hypothetical protein n=1 Tax=Acinetobacter schindleri TaxID=108981 RepID=UPI001615EE53|nr:hypothetical protein [Acinetobacter schindleri]MBB4835464.1 hypothetical protein [Acinetobacter schindleri]